jgi:hypothetical protein
MPRTLLQQPVEILNIVIWHVVNRPDLLSLGLTTKALACIVFPCHIQYHTVRASLQQVQTWQHLIRNRSCARYVRRLEVIRDSLAFVEPNYFELDGLLDRVEFDGVIGSSPNDIKEIEQDRWRERLLVLAIRGMSNLRTFAWRRACPPVISGGDDVWSALHHKEFLVNVHLSEMKMYAPAYALSRPWEARVFSILICPVSFFSLLSKLLHKVHIESRCRSRKHFSLLAGSRFCPTPLTSTVR